MQFLKGTKKSSHTNSDLWITCSGCNRMIYRREYDDNLKVCVKCGHHGRLTASERLELLIDDLSKFEEIAPEMQSEDPLGFSRDGLDYPDHLKRYKSSTGLQDAAVAGTACIDNRNVSIVVIDFRLLGASMGAVMGEKVTLATEKACLEHIPLIIVPCSGGARMQEGMVSLMQMAKTVAAIRNFHDQGGLYISILTDPTLAGVTASFASLADVLIAEPGATIGFTGRRLIEQIVKQKLPKDAQSAEFMLQHGMIDLVVQRNVLRDTLIKTLDLLAGPTVATDSQTHTSIPETIQ
mgnify:CR=1 FL=1